MAIKKLQWFKDNQSEKANVFSGYFEVQPEAYDECGAARYEALYRPYNRDSSLLGYAETAEKCKEIAQSYWAMLIEPWIETWISIKDKLPEPKKSVLCFCEHQNVFQEHIKWTQQNIGAKNGHDDEFWLDNYDATFVRVTHWTPLLDDPK